MTHGIAQLQLLLGHLNKQDRTGLLIEIDLEYLELLIGLGKCPLYWPETTRYKYVPNTWLTSIGHFLHSNEFRVETRTKRIFRLQRENDLFLMQLAIDGRFNLNHIQQCRLYLQVATLADVSNAEGTRLEKWAMTKTGRTSKITWPNQGIPSYAAWQEWRRFLRSLLTIYGRTAGRHLRKLYHTKNGFIHIRFGNGQGMIFW